MYNKRLKKGSLTIEACVSLPIFLFFFLTLLFLIKFACVNLALDYAVNGVAKQIAASSYPITFLNEYEDMLIEKYTSDKILTLEEEIEKISQYINSQTEGNGFDWMVLLEGKQVETEKIYDVLLESYKKGFSAYASAEAAKIYWELKSKAKYSLVNSLLERYLEGSIIDKDKLEIQLSELPQGEAEYRARSQCKLYEGLGLTPGKDFTRDDVVIQVEYRFEIPVPLLKGKSITMIHTAIEKAWLQGSCGTITNKEEGLDILDEAEPIIVYIAIYGKKYHKEDCKRLYKSKIPVRLEHAIEEGKLPCKVCKP